MTQELVDLGKDCLKFFVSTFITVLIFSLIALVAFSLHLLLNYLSSQGMNPFAMRLLAWADCFLLIADLMFLVIFVSKHLVEFIRTVVFDIMAASFWTGKS